MEVLKILNTSDAVNLLSGNYMEIISKYLAVAAMPILVIALINCFFGQKLFKILVGLAGIFIGAGLGAGICIGFNLLVKKDMPSVSMIIISIILGVIMLGFISFKLYKAGAFCMGFISGVILGIAIMKLMNKDDYLIAAVIGGLLMGLLAIDLYKHMVIILTSVNGGLIAAACIAIITKNDDPLFMLKLGLGLAIGGIVFQYILTLFGKKKEIDDEEEEDEDEDEDEKQQKRRKTDKRIAKSKQKKYAKNRAKQDEKKAKNKSSRKADNNANKKESAVKKKENDGAGFFLIDIIIEVAQGIKDRVNSYLNADDIADDEEDEEYDDADEYEEDEEYDDTDEYEDEEIDDYDEDDEEIDYIEDEDKNYEDKRYEDKKYQDKNYNQMEHDIVYKVKDSEKLEEDLRYPNKRSYYDNNFSLKDNKIVIKENEDANASYQDMEQKLTRELTENINIPLFDVDEIGAKLEEELENNLKNQDNDELEDLIIKQTIKDIDL
jgi:hypothetical protein